VQNVLLFSGNNGSLSVGVRVRDDHEWCNGTASSAIDGRKCRDCVRHAAKRCEDREIRTNRYDRALSLSRDVLHGTADLMPHLAALKGWVPFALLVVAVWNRWSAMGFRGALVSALELLLVFWILGIASIDKAPER